MYTLGQFREITRRLPDDFEMEIEAYFDSIKSGSVPTFNIITSRTDKRIVLLPQKVYISDGENTLFVEHQQKYGIC